MSTPKFESIDPTKLENVAGGTSRSSANTDITNALSSITTSLSNLKNNQNQGMDPMQMILIMMMMGGFGGGGGGVVAAPAAVGGVAGGPPVINVDTGVAGGGGYPWGYPGGGCRRGKKGW
jgi:hypothetical protein